MAIFDFESICVQEEKFRDTDTRTWTGRHVPISVSNSSNLIEKLIFSCNSNRGALVESFVGALDGSATQSNAQLKLKFSEVETSGRSKLNQIFSAHNQRRCRYEPVLEIGYGFFEEEEEEQQNVSTQFSQTQKNQFIELQDHLER